MIYDSPGNGTWRRTFIRNVSPWHLRLANWPMSHVDYLRGPTDDDIPMIVAKWVAASLVLIVAVRYTHREIPWARFTNGVLTRSDFLVR